MKSEPPPRGPFGHLLSERSPLLYRLRFAVSIFAMTILSGSIGYMLLLDLNFLDALYFTVVTLTTVGYGDILPLSPASRLFTIFFLLFGIIVASYSAALMVGAVVEGEVQGVLGRQRVVNRIKQRNNHIIICGFGRIGRDLAERFHHEGQAFVVVEQDEAAWEAGVAAGYLMLRGDATSDEVLLEAGIERARTIMPVLASDADNVFIIITARQLNPKINIVARATDEASAAKMKRAGTDSVVRPLHIGAQHLAQAVLRPTVLDFIYMSGHGTRKEAREEYALEEILVAPSSVLANHKLATIGNDLLTGVIVVGIKRASGQMVFNPRSDTEIQAGDTMVAMGNTTNMNQLAKLAGRQANLPVD